MLFYVRNCLFKQFIKETIFIFFSMIHEMTNSFFLNLKLNLSFLHSSKEFVNPLLSLDGLIDR